MKIIIYTLLTICALSSVYAADKTKSGGNQYIRKIQAVLTQLNYKPGKIDGFLGKSTREAISKFQSDAGLPVTGKDSDKLRDYLYVYTLPITRSKKPGKRCSYKLHFLTGKNNSSIEINNHTAACKATVRTEVAESLSKMPMYELITSQAGWRKWSGNLGIF